MGQNTDSIIRFLQYSFKVLPELRRQAAGIANRKNLCIAPCIRNQTALSKETEKRERPDNSLLASSLFALYPGADTKSTLSFILSLYTLSDTLRTYRSTAGISNETEIHSLYHCMSSAADPSRSKGCALTNRIDHVPVTKKEEAAIPCLSDQCRLQLAIVPAFQLVAPKLKKYMQLYVDMQSYRYYTEASHMGHHLEEWSEYYLKRYPGISCWEFCAACDSLLGIAAMYAAATDSKVTPEEIRLLDEGCFPWLCGLDSLLHAYLCERITNSTGHFNFTSFYGNLKACEERILFFGSKAEEACMKLKESSFFMHLVRNMTGLYLTDPDASFGMYRLVSLNILKKSSYHSALHNNACRLMRLAGII
ncbi:MAG: DUF2600 family protein [Clostridiaceae bacterium]